MLCFLGVNGLWLEATEDEVVGLVLGVAEGRIIRLHPQPF
jgi:prophage maintenance system killer protein